MPFFSCLMVSEGKQNDVYWRSCNQLLYYRFTELVLFFLILEFFICSASESLSNICDAKISHFVGSFLLS